MGPSIDNLFPFTEATTNMQSLLPCFKFAQNFKNLAACSLDVAKTTDTCSKSKLIVIGLQHERQLSSWVGHSSELEQAGCMFVQAFLLVNSYKFQKNWPSEDSVNILVLISLVDCVNMGKVQGRLPASTFGAPLIFQKNIIQYMQSLNSIYT